VFESTHQRPNLFDGLALDRHGHHRRRTLADRATLARKFDIPNHAVGDVQKDADVVAAQRVVALCADGGRGQFAAVARRSIVIENYFSVEIFDSRHGGSFKSSS